MLYLALVFVLPIAVLVGWVVLLIRGPRVGLAISALMFVAAMVAGSWSILQSRSSTAGIAFLALPGFSALTGTIAYVFGRLRLNDRTGLRLVGWLCLCASVGLTAFTAYGGVRQRAKNRGRDEQALQDRRVMDHNREAIARLIREHDGQEAAALDAEIVSHHDDRNFLIPALETPYVTPERLDELAGSADLGVVLSVARNSQTEPATLARIYRTGTYPPYFFQALAENGHTPVEILRLVDQDRRAFGPGAMDRSFARNPSTPHDMLERIAASGDVYALRNLLQNSALDCGLLRTAAKHLGASDRNEILSSGQTIADLDARLCATK